VNRQRTVSVLSLAATTVLWAFPPIAIKYLSAYYDGFTQNMYRYGISFVFVLMLSFMRGRNVFRMKRSDLVRLLGPTIPNICFQTLWAAALYAVYPAFAAILGRTWVLYSIFLAVVLFPEEREVVGSPRFILGSVLSLAGMAGITLLRPGTLGARFDMGTVLVLASALGWAMYSIQIRRAVTVVDPSDSFVVVSGYTTVALAVLAFVFGSPAKIFDVPFWVNVILVLSGIGCIALAHTTYYIAIRGLGVSICATFVLLSSLLVIVLSYFIFGEKLTGGQLVSGLVLLMGSAVVIWTSNASRPPDPRSAPSS
jgi:drug/metabolite transporter (DMT)-like permease